MGRAPCCDKQLGLKKGPWTADEDDILTSYISKHGPGNWRSLPKLAGLLRCGKSCRLRWTNYLRPDIKRGSFTAEEEKLVIQLHGILGNKWAAIASQLSGRTDNEVKNLWNTHLRKRLQQMGLDPQTHKPISTACGIDSKSASARHMAQWESARLQAESRLSRESLLFSPTQAKADTTDDYFLRIWNSEIGDSFRKLKKGSEMACQSPISQASSSTKCGSVSGITLEIGQNTGNPCSKDSNEDENKHKSAYRYGTLAESDSSSSNELEDSSDTALQLLLDFPINNDMSFLGHSDDYFSCH